MLSLLEKKLEFAEAERDVVTKRMVELEQAAATPVSKAITNADHIRAMSDEELAKFLNVAGCPCPEKDCRPTCEVCIEEWLQQPAEEAAEDGN